MPVIEESPKVGSNTRSRAAGTVIASGLLLGALALVVLYTSRPMFLSPLSMVVVAAVGVAALLLQARLQPEAVPANARPSSRGSLWFTSIGVGFSIGAVFGDVLHLKPWFMGATALAAVVCFAAGGIVLLNMLRKRPSLTP